MNWWFNCCFPPFHQKCGADGWKVHFTIDSVLVWKSWVHRGFDQRPKCKNDFEQHEVTKLYDFDWYSIGYMFYIYIIYIYTHTLYIYIHKYTIYINMHTHMYICIYMHKYTCICICIYACLLSWCTDATWIPGGPGPRRALPGIGQGRTLRHRQVARGSADNFWGDMLDMLH